MKKVSLKKEQELLQQSPSSLDAKHETRKAAMRSWYHKNREKVKREKKELDNAVPYALELRNNALELRNKEMVLQIAQEELKRSQVVTSRYLYMSLLFCCTAILMQLISTMGSVWSASINYI